MKTSLYIPGHLLASVGAISAAVLAYEITLMRIFSITQWHHFAYMIISIALLGFGASGTCISLFRKRFTRNFRFYYRLFACLFPVSILLSYVLSQYNKFNPFEIVWNPRQYLYVLEYYLILFLPFLFAALCIGLVFTCYADRIGLLYCLNLVGSGIGVLGVVACFWVFHPVLVLYIILGIALSGAITAFWRMKRSLWGFLALTFLVSVSLYYDPLTLRDLLNVSQYKGLSLAENYPEAEILTASVSPLGIVHTVSSPIIRHAPGLSLNYTGDIPSQIGIFIDSGEAGSIIRMPDVNHAIFKEAQSLEFLRFLPSSLAYYVRPVSSVLVLGAGGGTDVLSALYHDATSVDALELNRDIIDLVQYRFRDLTSGLYLLPQVRVINQEARGFVESTNATYDLIQISLLDAFGASSAGVHALHENYLYTVEALKRYYSRLNSQGILSITRWVKFPPRDNIKLFATAVEALEKSGVTEAAQHLVSIRSWATNTLLVSKSPVTLEDIDKIRAFCHKRSFDTNYFPGIQVSETNLYNQLSSSGHEQVGYYHTAQAILSDDRENFYASYPYYIRPAHDNSPYFFHFFTWRSFTTLLKTIGRDWVPFVEWGYLVLLATLVQAGVLSIILVLLPLFFLPRRSTLSHYKFYTIIYFSCLGLGYLFVEMVCIQKFTLFLANPVAAVSVVIASFLIFSGLGSLYFELQRTSRKSILLGAVGGIIGLILLYVFLLSRLFALCAGWSYPFKVLLSILCIAPLGFCMGIPFPFGLNRLHRQADPLVPWAYGINGYASVLSSLIATCIAISFGFHIVMLWAGILYLTTAGVTYIYFGRT